LFRVSLILRGWVGGMKGAALARRPDEEEMPLAV
jgi:hypothetical protein